MRPLESGARGPQRERSRRDDARQSVVLGTTVNLVFHTIVVFSAYLLFAGHNQPGGGFVGGLTAGVALVLLYVAGGPAALRRALPVEPSVPLGLGLVLSCSTGLVALLVGGDYLESAYRTFSVPLLGDVKLTSALAFDTGVYLVVVGLVLGLLRTLGVDSEDEQ